jgi:DNA-binding XRE family transcriptional regulator
LDCPAGLLIELSFLEKTLSNESIGTAFRLVRLFEIFSLNYFKIKATQPLLILGLFILLVLLRSIFWNSTEIDSLIRFPFLLIKFLRYLSMAAVL